MPLSPGRWYRSDAHEDGGESARTDSLEVERRETECGCVERTPLERRTQRGLRAARRQRDHQRDLQAVRPAAAVVLDVQRAHEPMQ